MGIKRTGKVTVLFCLALVFALLLSGCRVRTNGSGTGENGKAEGGLGMIESGPRGETEPDPDEAVSAASDVGRGSATKENPEASRKEFDENAPVEIAPGTQRELNAEGEGIGTAVNDGEAGTSAHLLNELAEETAEQTVPADEAEQTGVSPEGEEADSVLTYYTALLQDRMGSLFECQRLNVYWETEEDHVTVHKTSPEHELILNAGAYDVSARLLEENLRVDDGWIVRKNPGVIVKVVNSSVLGSGVHSAAAAKAVYESLASRDGFRGIDAVRNRRVLIISQEMLETRHLQTAVMLLIAKTANEDVMSDVVPAEALKMLAEEATGLIPGGTYYYTGKGD